MTADPSAIWTYATRSSKLRAVLRNVVFAAPFPTDVTMRFVRAARNLPNIDVLPVQGINVYDILRRRTLVLTKAAIAALEERFADAVSNHAAEGSKS